MSDRAREEQAHDNPGLLPARQPRREPRCIPPGQVGGWYRPLSDGDVRRIHAASLTVLERTGIEVQASECREIFRRAGATIDEQRNRVFIPRSMVEDALGQARSEVVLCGRERRHDLCLSGRRVHMGTGGAAIKLVDLDSGVVRESTLADVANIGRLVDALDNIHFYLRPCIARDIPIELLDVNTYYAAMSSTTKHVTGNCFSVKSLHDVIEMASLVAGGYAALCERPIVSFITCWVVSPLRYEPSTVEVLTEVVRRELPVFLSSAPQAGATSPAALAGTLVQINAEELSGLTYAQLVRPRAPVVLGYVPSVSDLRTGNFIGGAAEFALMNAAVAQLGQFYNLPVYNSSGLTDSKLPDIQAGYEKGISSLAAALAGANYIHHAAGFLESMATVAYDQYVIDDDIVGSVMRAVRGIEVSDAALSLDVIDRVCSGGAGHFLGTRQSKEMATTEYYYPHTADRQRRDDWEAGGGLDMAERARARARDILATHVPEPIPADVDALIRQRFEIRM